LTVQIDRFNDRKTVTVKSLVTAVKKNAQHEKQPFEFAGKTNSTPLRSVHVWLSATYDGSVHDKKICDQQPLHLPNGITLWQDTGFLGHTCASQSASKPENVHVKMPTKKPKGKELTDEHLS
jgi:hypothetical protein